MEKEVSLGIRWEWMHSLWMVFLFTPYTLPISYFYVGIRMHRRKWIVNGYFYLISLGGVMYVIRLYGDVYEEILFGIPLVIYVFLNGLFRSGNARREYLLYLAEHMDPDKKRELVERELQRQGSPNSNVLTKTQMFKRQSAKTKFVMTESERNNTAEVINMNKATAKEIAYLPAVGSLLADKIIYSREISGPFASFDELITETGIKARIMNEAKRYMAFADNDITSLQKELAAYKQREIREKSGIPGRNVDL